MSWKLALPQYPEALLVSTVMELVVLAHNLILLSFHIYSSIIAKRKSDQKQLETLQILSFVVIIFSMIWSLANIAISFSLKPSFLTCKQFIDILLASYTLTKISVYTFFLQRLYSVFTVHKYKFSAQSKRYARLWLLVYFITVQVIGVTTCKHYPIIENNRIVCVGNYPLYALAIGALLDFGTITTLSIVFTRRLMLLTISDNMYSVCETLYTNKVIESNDKVVMIALNEDEKMMAMMKRITLLTMISLVTTFISLMLTAVFQLNSLWIGIEFCINNWCIVLMFKYNGTGANIVMSDNCLSCFSLNICFPIQLQSNVMHDLNKASGTVEIDDTKSTQTSNPNEYEMIMQRPQEEESQLGSIVVTDS